MSLTKGITVNIATPDFGLRNGSSTTPKMKPTPCTRCHLARIPLDDIWKQCPDCRTKGRMEAAAVRKRKQLDAKARVTLTPGNLVSQNLTGSSGKKPSLKRPLEGEETVKVAKRKLDPTPAMGSVAQAKGGANANGPVQGVPLASSTTGVVSTTLAGPSTNPQLQVPAIDIDKAACPTTLSTTHVPILAMPPRNPNLRDEHMRIPSTSVAAPSISIIQHQFPVLPVHAPPIAIPSQVTFDIPTAAPLPKKRRHPKPTPLEFQTSTELHAYLKICYASPQRQSLPPLRFNGHYSIVADPTIQNAARADVVVKQLREIAGLSFAIFPRNRRSQGKKPIQLKYACKCVTGNAPSCGGAVVVRVEDDNSHPMSFIKGQKVRVRIEHP